MTQPKQPDRAAILKRRAIFVGSALSTLTGCPQQQPPVPDPPSVSVAPATTGSAPAPSPTPAPIPKPEGKMPPLVTPTNAAGQVKSEYDRLNQAIPKVHALLDDAEKEVATICSIDQASCESRWKTVAKKLAQVDDQLRELEPLCPGTSDAAKKFEAWLNDHFTFIRARKAKLEAHIQTLHDNADKKQRWKAELAAATVPQPCLDFSCNDW